jgi:hypothetical protein
MCTCIYSMKSTIYTAIISVHFEFVSRTHFLVVMDDLFDILYESVFGTILYMFYTYLLH